MKETVRKGGKELRLGFTTGSCAAMAAGAAARMLLSGEFLHQAALTTPRGISVSAPVEDSFLSPSCARCAIAKDAGDDPDITHGVRVYAAVTKTPGGDITIDGGEGVGRITRRGLDQPVGAAAINRVPREMIFREVAAARDRYGYDGGLRVVISIPGGEALAAKTFNPQLGIAGGLSIIGTTGIVEPMSVQALVDTIEVELKMHAAQGVREILLTPGNYGLQFLADHPGVALRPVVKCSNYLGEALDLAALHGFDTVLVVGHVGKLVKAAGGILDTHSRVADGRMELLALGAALSGASQELLEAILEAVTTDEALNLLAAAGLREPVMAWLLARADHYLARRARGAFQVGLSMFSLAHGPLGVSPQGIMILERWRRDAR